MLIIYQHLLQKMASVFARRIDCFLFSKWEISYMPPGVRTKTNFVGLLIIWSYENPIQTVHEFLEFLLPQFGFTQVKSMKINFREMVT